MLLPCATRYSLPMMGLLGVLVQIVVGLLNGCAPTPEFIADKWVETHSGLSTLRVHATEIACEALMNMSAEDALLDDEAACQSPNATKVTIVIFAVMTPDAYEVEIRRDGTSATDPADMTWSFQGSTDNPVFIESRREKKTGKVTIASTMDASPAKIELMRLNKTGVGDNLLGWDLFDPIGSCSGAEFLRTWIQDTTRFPEWLRTSQYAGTQQYRGQTCYILRSTSYDITSTDREGEVHRNRRSDVFFVDASTFRLMGQQTSRVDAHPQKLKAWYWFDEAIYSYPKEN